MVGIVTNIAAQSAQANLTKASTDSDASVYRLSSGNAIYRASDDVAGLSVGTILKTNVIGYQAALKNTAQAGSLLNVADGALANIQNMLSRQFDLATQATSGSLSDTARGFLDQEFQALKSQIDQIANNTTFNGIKLLDGSLYNVGGIVQSNTTLDTTTNTASATFGSSTIKQRLTQGTGGVAFTSGPIGSGLLKVTLSNHGLSNGDTIAIANTSAAVDGITAAQINAANSVFNVIDKDNFWINTAGAATAGNTAAAGGTFLDLSYTGVADMLDGKTLTINGVTFTGKTAGVNYTGAAGEVSVSLGQTATQLANNLVSAINNYKTLGGTNAYLLDGLTVTANTGTISIATTEGGAAGTTVYMGSSSDTVKFTGTGAATNQKLAGTVQKLSGGAAGALTTMNYHAYGTPNDSILNSLAGSKASTTFTVATNPITAGGGATLAIGTVATNGTSNSLTVTQTGHGFINGDVINFAGAITLTAGSGLTAAAGNYTVTVVDQDHYTISGGNLSGTYTGVSATSSATNAYTINTGYAGDVLNVNGKQFQFVSSLTAGATNQILVGATAAATAANIVQTLNNSTDPGVSQATYSNSGTTVTVTYKTEGAIGSKFTLGGTSRSANLTFTASNLASGGTALTGVDLTGLTNNAAILGNISGFKAQYTGTSNKVNLSLDLGGYTYTANNVTTNPTSNTWISLVSTADNNANTAGGGVIRLQLAANNGVTVTSQSGVDNNSADIFGARLNKAFSTINITQRRAMTDYQNYGDIYNGTTKIGTLSSSAIYITDTTFNSTISGVSVIAPGLGATDATITFTMDGQTYQSTAGIGSSFASGSYITLTNTLDTNKKIEYLVGNNTLDVSTTSNALAVQEAIKNALGIGAANANSGLNFQVGLTSQDSIRVSIKGTRAQDIYLDSTGVLNANINVATQAGANTAIGVLSNAINIVSATRASTGAAMSRINYASENIQTSAQNLDAARSVFLDVDIAAESSRFASEQVKVQAAISVLAQANQLPLNLLKLLS